MLSIYLELTKPRLSFLSILTAAAAFYLASLGVEGGLQFFHMLIGTSLVAGGANAFNQWMERDIDALMDRTSNRPLPTGRLRPQSALLFAITVSIAGVAYLFIFTNFLTGLLGLLALLSYLLLYTPLKRKTNLCTLVGGIPGALPPMMGWAAARGRLDLGAWTLFSILYLWQLPHFLALGWRFREDYRRADLPMLPVLDQGGKVTGRQIVLYTLALIPVSLAPTFTGLSGAYYFFGALLLGLIYLALGMRAFITPNNRNAMNVFLASILYLPILMGLMMIDKR